MKSIIFILFIIALSNVVNCGIYKVPFFLDDDQNELTNEVYIPNQKDTPIVGAPRKINSDDEYINRLLNEHLGRLITGDSNKIIIDEIEEITQQVVAGSLYKVKGHYIIEGQKKYCTVTILSQPWIQEEAVVISGKCDDGSCYVTESYTCSPDSLYSTFSKRENRLKLFV